MEIKFFKKIEKYEPYRFELKELFIEECLTKEAIDKKNEDNLKIIKTISNCLSEYQILSEEQLIEAYRDKYPLPVSDQDIEKIIGKILKNFKTPFNENERNFLKKPLINVLDKEIFVDERTYYFNLKMSMNIPLLLEKPISFKGNSKTINRFVIGIISRNIDPNFSKKCEIKKQGRIVDLKKQLLARYQNNRCSISIRDLICFSKKLSRLNQKDRNKFLIGLDNGLFSQGSPMDYDSSAKYFKGRYEQRKFFGAVGFIIFLLILLDARH